MAALFQICTFYFYFIIFPLVMLLLWRCWWNKETLARARALQSPSAAIDALEATRTFFLLLLERPRADPLSLLSAATEELQRSWGTSVQ
uniref:Uncharacterized protein n=1 Tax=Ixodes ricinus TaxID=34613 RepID=A0A6B0U2T4_IXORI